MLIDLGYLTPISGKGNRINKVDNQEEKDELCQLIEDIKFKGYNLQTIKKRLEKMIEEEEKENDPNK